MRWVYVVALYYSVCAASAAAYDEFMRGMEANHANDADLAITEFTSALNAGDLAAAYVPDAYFGRASAYLQKQRCAAALADLDEALKARPKFLPAYYARANANACLDKGDAVRADLDKVIEIAPTTGAYRSRGSYYWNHAQFAQAADDFAQSLKLPPKSGFNLLWFAISASRAGTLDLADFGRKVSDLDLDDWPAPLLDFFRGKVTADDVYRKAARGDGEVPANQKCEADFYIGEWRLIAKDPSAKSLIQQAEQECPRNFVEYSAAHEELKRVP